MKIFIINSRQKKKLLNLSEELFPEIPKIFWVGVGNDHLYLTGNNQIGVHWYLWCITNLARRIDSKINRSKRVEIFDIIYDNYEELVRGSLKYHPVDFFYNYVQHCKSKKYFK